MYSVAGMTFRHSGQRDPVRRGSPFWSFDGIVTIALSWRLSLYICRTRPPLYSVPHRDILVLSRLMKGDFYKRYVVNATTSCERCDNLRPAAGISFGNVHPSARPQGPPGLPRRSGTGGPAAGQGARTRGSDVLRPHRSRATRAPRGARTSWRGRVPPPPGLRPRAPRPRGRGPPQAHPPRPA